jgi:pimeloyl-ACP methyl ester carboxylesterase
VRAFDTGVVTDAAATVLWHPGSPHTGEPPEPLVAAATARGIRLVSFARPGYGGSTQDPGRHVASVAGDARAVVDALGVDRFGVLGYSGGGPHALACAALLPDRVVAAATLAGVAPFSGDEAWFDGMHAPVALRAAAVSREARAALAKTDEFEPGQFVDTDWAALEGEWGALGRDAQRAEAAGRGGLIDDDVAFTRPWGFDLGDVRAPVLLVHGERDRVVPRSHAVHLLAGLPQARLWMRLDEGHVAVLNVVPDALDWLRERIGVSAPAGHALDPGDAPVRRD